MKTPKRLPKSCHRFFWDIAAAKLNPAKFPKYTTERLLEYGDQKAVAWMQKSFTKKQIIEVLKNSRNLSAKSANFWAVIYNVPKDQVRCLEEDFRKLHRMLWPY